MGGDGADMRQMPHHVANTRQRLDDRDGVEFCRTLPERAGVVAIPAAIFYDDKEAARSQVRFAFCKRPEILTEALSRLSRLSGT